MTRRCSYLFALAVLLVAFSVLLAAQQESIDDLRTRTEAGDAEAQFTLGMSTNSTAEAVRWYRLAADQGHAPSRRSTSGLCTPKAVASHRMMCRRTCGTTSLRHEVRVRIGT